MKTQRKDRGAVTPTFNPPSSPKKRQSLSSPKVLSSIFQKNAFFLPGAYTKSIKKPSPSPHVFHTHGGLHSNNAIKKRIRTVYEHVIQGKALKDWIRTNKDPENPQRAMEEYGFRRGYLGECACPTFSREEKPGLREKYEICVVENLKPFFQNKFDIGIVFFGSAELLQDQNILFHMIHKIKHMDDVKQGRIRAIFIDKRYADIAYDKEAIEKKEHSCLQSSTPYIQQFHFEMAHLLPKNLCLQTAFFRSTEEYIAWAKKNPKQFGSHCAFGADIEGAYPELDKIRKSLNHIFDPIVLASDSEGAFITSLPNKKARNA